MVVRLSALRAGRPLPPGRYLILLKPAKLKEHLTSVHPENASKDACFFFRAKKAQFEKAGTLSKLGFAS
jgi:hypothetical protein